MSTIQKKSIAKTFLMPHFRMGEGRKVRCYTGVRNIDSVDAKSNGIAQSCSGTNLTPYRLCGREIEEEERQEIQQGEDCQQKQ